MSSDGDQGRGRAFVKRRQWLDFTALARGTLLFCARLRGVGEMSVRMRGLVAIVVAGLALAACGSGAASPEQAVILPADSVPLPRAAPKFAAAPVPADSVPLPRAAPKFAAAPVVATWWHVPEPVSTAQFNQDQANCTELANNAPGVGSPAVKFYLAFTNCMRSAGYEARSNL